ncbi:MAG: hypothetical protein V1701_08950 [Planctomycetota bacterium]
MKLLSRMSGRERTLFYVTLTAVGFFLIMHFVISPMRNKLSNLNSQIEQFKQEINNDKIILSREKAINDKHEKYRDYLREPKSDADTLGDLVKTVTELANNWGLVIVSNKPAIEEKENKDAKTKKNKYYLLTLETEGKMSQLVNFLYELNTKKQMIYIEKVELSPKVKKSDILRASITIYETFIQ